VRIACFCGQIFDGDELSACSRCHTPVSLPSARLQAWIAEHARITASMEWAFAMGSGCSMGPKSSRERALLRRVDELAALIAEHT
jgi:hypothetical protein